MKANNRLEILGSKLTAARKAAYPTDTQQSFSLRIEVSKATYAKMEKGDLSVTLEKYYKAAKLLGLESGFDRLFEQRRNILDD